MKIISTNEFAEFRRYRARILMVGSLAKHEDPLSKNQGIYDYIEIIDLDTQDQVSLQRVAVYMGCAPLIREGDEVEFVYGNSKDGTSVNAILGTWVDGQVRSDYCHFHDELMVSAKTLHKTGNQALLASVPVFLASLPLLLWIWPGLLMWVLVGFLLFTRRKALGLVKRIMEQIPSPDAFGKMLVK